MGVMNSVLDMLRWRRLGKHSRYEDRPEPEIWTWSTSRERWWPKTRGKIETVQRTHGKCTGGPNGSPATQEERPSTRLERSSGEMEGKPGDRGVKPREESVSRREWTTVSNAAKEVKQDKI